MWIWMSPCKYNYLERFNNIFISFIYFFRETSLAGNKPKNATFCHNTQTSRQISKPAPHCTPFVKLFKPSPLTCSHPSPTLRNTTTHTTPLPSHHAALPTSTLLSHPSPLFSQPHLSSSFASPHLASERQTHSSPRASYSCRAPRASTPSCPQ